MYKIWGVNTVVWGIKWCHKYLVTVYKIWAATQTAFETHHLECLSFLIGPSVALLQLTKCSQHERWCQRRDRSKSHLYLLSAGWQMKPHTSHPGCSRVQRSCIAPGVMNGSILVGFSQAAQFRAAEQQLDNNRTPADICITSTAERIESWKLLSGANLLFLLPSLLRIFALRNT